MFPQALVLSLHPANSNWRTTSRSPLHIGVTIGDSQNTSRWLTSQPNKQPLTVRSMSLKMQNIYLHNSYTCTQITSVSQDILFRVSHSVLPLKILYTIAYGKQEYIATFKNKPELINNSTASLCPCQAATCKGVKSSWALRSTFPAWVSNNRNKSWLFCLKFK